MNTKDNSKITIHDVAKAAGVSATTVSRVLNDNGYPVRKAVKERVLDAVNELNYTPNAVAKNLKTNNVKDIGVIIPTITNPFYQQAILGIQSEMDRKGYNILLCNSFRDEEKEENYLRSLSEKQIRGVIISSISQNSKKISEYTARGIKFVMLDQKISETDDCTHINFDYLYGARLVVRHLLEKGHSKIAFVTSPFTRWSRRSIYKGFCNELMTCNLPFPDDYLLICEEEKETDEMGYDFKAGEKMAAEYIKRGLDATAVVAVNDMMAMGFIRGLKANNIKVPDDVSVTGFDNIPFASMFSPALTTIHCPSYETGKLAGKLLLDKLEMEDSMPVSVKLDPFLIERESVKDIKKSD